MAAQEFTTAELANEIWKDAAGYEGRYSVSNIGRVRRDTAGTNTYAGRIMRPVLKRTGYYALVLRSQGRKINRLVHHLVTEAFLGPCPSDKVRNHISGVKTDNRVKNLEYITRKENAAHAAKSGLYPSGKNHYRVIDPSRAPRGEDAGPAKLNELQVRVIKRLLPVMTHRAIAALFNVCRPTVTDIKKGKTWKHI